MMIPTVYKVLTHGAVEIENPVLPIGQLSGEAVVISTFVSIARVTSCNLNVLFLSSDVIRVTSCKNIFYRFNDRVGTKKEADDADHNHEHDDCSDDFVKDSDGNVTCHNYSCIMY